MSYSWKPSINLVARDERILKEQLENFRQNINWIHDNLACITNKSSYKTSPHYSNDNSYPHNSSSHRTSNYSDYKSADYSKHRQAHFDTNRSATHKSIDYAFDNASGYKSSGYNSYHYSSNGGCSTYNASRHRSTHHSDNKSSPHNSSYHDIYYAGHLEVHPKGGRIEEGRIKET